MATTRRVGLSSTAFKGPSLHEIDNGMRTRTRRSNPIRSSPKHEHQVEKVESRFGVPLTDEEINAAPIGSDDEDDGPVNRVSDDSDVDGAQSADIQPSFLAKRKLTSYQDKQHIHNSDKKSEAESPPGGRLRRKGNSAAENVAKKAKVGTYLTSDQDDGLLFGGTEISKRVKSTYASKAKKLGRVGSQSNGDTSPEATFKRRDTSILNSPVSPEKRFRNTRLDPDLAQTPEPEAPKFKIFDLADINPALSPETPKFNLNMHLKDLVDSQCDVSSFRLADAIGSTKRGTEGNTDLSTEPPLKQVGDREDIRSQTPLFRIPLDLQDETLNANFALFDDLGHPTTDNEVADTEESSFKTVSSPTVPSRQAKCPMCGAAVEAEFLKNYSDGKQMNTRIQANFCRAHKKRSAQEEWVIKGYPTIDWSTLDTRIADHHTFLQSLLDGASSYSRDVLEDEIKSGKDRTLAQAIMNSDVTLTPGYYGTRGLRAMSENIMYEFSPQLRKIAVADRLVSARGVTGYVQMVLVPELAVRLIAEDMSVGVDEARQIMKESVGFGDLLNEEIEDVVVLQEGDGFDI